MYSKASLTEDEALDIAQAYFKGDKDPPKMALILGIDQFDLNLLMHPLVRRHIVRLQKAVSAQYSLEEHITKLKEIRDAALGEDNFKVALSAETQVGKAAGLYEPKVPGDDDKTKDIDPTKISTAQLRQMLAKSIGAVIPNGEASELPAPLRISHDEEEPFEDDSEI